MSQKEKIATTLLFIIAVVNSFVGLHSFYLTHTTSVPNHGGQYREGMLGQARFINPVLATSSLDISLSRVVFSGLYTYDENGALVPDLAENLPQISEDQKHYTVKLKQNVLWQDNTPLGADDVVFTIKTIQDPTYKSPERGNWLQTTVDKQDQYTVIFTTKDIAGPFVHNLTLPIIPKHIWEQINAENFALSNINLEAIGTGPYVIREIRKLPSGKILSIKTEAFAQYYKGQASIQTIEFIFYDSYEDVINALHSKEIQGFGFVPFDKDIIQQGHANLQTLETPLTQYNVLFFNLNNKILSDKSVREALRAGTNTTKILEQALHNHGLSLAASDQTYYNPKQAATLLDQAGWVVDTTTGIRSKNNTPLELTLATSDFSLNSKLAQMISEDWQQLQIIVHLNILPTKELSETIMRPRKFDALLFAQKTGPDPDPFSFWHSSQIKNPGLNLSAFSNSQADKLISEARNTTNNAVREEKYQQFNNILNNEVPALFLIQNIYAYIIDKNVKTTKLNILYDPSFRFINVERWYVKEKRAWK